MGRQPWVVYGLLKTSQASSTDVSLASIVISIAGYVLLYGFLIVVGARLFIREIKHGPERQRRTRRATDRRRRARPGLLT